MAGKSNWTIVASYVQNSKTTAMDNNRFSGSKLLADMKKGQNLSKWEPELCIKLLQLPRIDNYSPIEKLIQKASKEWIVEFLDRDGLGTLLNNLREMGGKSLLDTISQLQCVKCLRAVVRSRTGLQYISTRLEYSSYLASVLVSNNTTVKLQVYELLCALYVFSEDGIIFVKDVLSHIKIKKGLRHNYEIIVNELQQADTFAYQTTLLALVNCLILVGQNLEKRMCIRNEFLALGLRKAIDNMAGYEDDNLQIQITVFEEHLLTDENQAPQKSHQELLEELRTKISNTLYDSYLQNILLQLLKMDYTDSKINDIWNLINDVVCNDPQMMLDIYRKTSNTHATGSQTVEMRLNKHSSSPNIRRNSLDTSKDKRAITKTKRPSLPTFRVVNGLNENINSKHIKNPIQCSIFTQTDLACYCPGSNGSIGFDCNLEPNNNHLSISDENRVKSCKCSELLECSPIPPPPPMPLLFPLLSRSEIPPHPTLPCQSEFPLPCQSNIPSPPPLPGQSKIPSPPPLPSQSQIPSPPPTYCNWLLGIPPPPPLLGQSIIPQPPPLPCQSKIPSPPPLPYQSEISPPSPLSCQSQIPLPPPLPSQSEIPLPPSQFSCLSGIPLSPPSPLMNTVELQPAILPETTHMPLQQSLSKTSISELGQMTYVFQNVVDGHRTMPTRRANNNIQFHSLPKTKMKTLNWNKVNNEYLNNSVWSSAYPPDLTQNFKKKIHELFCQKPRIKHSPANMSINGVSKVNIINVLDSKRSLAINIMLKQFKSGSEEIIQALRNGTSISIEKLKGLQRVLPTDDEIKMIKKQFTDPATIGTAELFCLNLNDIPNCQLKIKLMIEKEELPVTVSEIQGQIDKIKAMCYNLINDQPFKQFLSLILCIGNYLNDGSYAGNAKGFTLDTLPKLVDTRANKPRVTFLHFVVEVAQTSTNDILSFTKYTSALRDLSRISFSSLEDEIKIITQQIRSLHSELSKQLKTPIYKQFSEFMRQAVEDVEQINKEYKGIIDVIEKVAVHFGENVNKFKIEECFGLLGNFFERIDVAAKENINRQIQEEKNHMVAMKLEKEKDNPRTLKSLPPKEKDVCLVNLLMRDIKKGSFNLKSVKQKDDLRDI